MLAPYFRDVLLAPRRRAEDGAVTWQWTEPPRAPPASTGDLRVLRRRLADAQERLADNLAGPMRTSGSAAPDRRRADLDQLVPVMARLTGEMATWDDARLAAHACRTEGGWRLHTWGTAASPTVRYPDETAPTAETGAPLPATPPRRRRFGFWWTLGAAALGVAFLWIRKPEAVAARDMSVESVVPQAPVQPSEIPPAAATEVVRPVRSEGKAGGSGNAIVVARGESGPMSPGRSATLGWSAAGQPAVQPTVERVVPLPVSPLAPGLTPGQAGAGAAPPLAGAPVGLPEFVESSSSRTTAAIDLSADSDSKSSTTTDPVRHGARAETRAAVVTVADVVPSSSEDTAPHDEERSTRADPVAEPVVNSASEGTGVELQGSARVPDALMQTLRVPWREWRLRLVGDAIVPTQPRPVGRSADTSPQRTLLFAQRQAQVPPVLQAAEIRCGLDFERVDPTATQPERWTWRADAMAEAAADRGVWSGAPGVPEAVAQVQFDAATRSLVVRVGEGVRAVLWFEVVGMPRHWRWQAVSGLPLAAAGEARVVLPLRTGDEAAAARSLVLIDPESGWGLVGGG